MVRSYGKWLILILNGLFLLYFNLSFAQESTTTTTTTVQPTTTTTIPVTTTVPVTTSVPVTTTVQRQVIVTPAPAAKEVTTAPTGYVSCFTVAAGWNDNIWVPEHQVCQYANQPSGTVWVSGYWACTTYKSDTGECTNWDWKPGRWEKTLVVY